MNNPGLPSELWQLLDGGLWHATDRRGLNGIVADGFIRVSEAERYKNSVCRRIGCVALFDFGPSSSDQDDFEFSNWVGWFGAQMEGRTAIWLRIERGEVARNLLEPPAIALAAKPSNGGGLFFVGVEAGHRGPVPANAVTGGFVIDQHDRTRFEVHAGLIGLPDAVAAFEKSLPPPPQLDWFQQALQRMS